MIETPQIVPTEARITAKIRLTVPRTEIRKVMEPGIKEVISALAAQGIAPAGPLFHTTCVWTRTFSISRFVCPSPRLLSQQAACNPATCPPRRRWRVRSIMVLMNSSAKPGASSSTGL